MWGEGSEDEVCGDGSEHDMWGERSEDEVVVMEVSMTCGVKEVRMWWG